MTDIKERLLKLSLIFYSIINKKTNKKVVLGTGYLNSCITMLQAMCTLSHKHYRLITRLDIVIIDF